ncbi:Alpha/Beta hydrolase protein [Cryomyces antarcticus]
MASAQHTTQATTMDKIGMIPVMFRALLTAVGRMITSPLRGDTGATTYFKDVAYAVLRTQLAHMSLAQEQYMNPSTDENYLELAKNKGFQPDSVVLSDGSKGHWLGNKGAEKVIVYFHGGGYVLPASPGHVTWAYELNQSLNKAGHSTSLVFLAYTTAPGGQYPTQTTQATELLRHVIEKEGKKPSDIIIGGDSAGGNLTLALMSHLLHPHFQASQARAVRTPARSRVDLPVAAAQRWSEAFLGGARLDEYNQPTIADDDWFKGLENVVSEILVWGGGGEVLIDSIVEIAKKLQKAHPKTELIVQPKVGHEEFIIDTLLGYKEKAEGTVLMENWIGARL